MAEEGMFDKALNGKIAKEIVIYFFSAIEKAPTPQEFSKSMVFAKRLLKAYTKDSIIYAIDKYKTRMYSIAYLNSEVMNKCVHALNHIEEVEVSTFDKENKRNTRGDENCADRNRKKLQRLSHEPRFRTEHNFDMLKEPKSDT